MSSLSHEKVSISQNDKISYEKYIKYKIKYLKLKELEKELMNEGKLSKNYNILKGGNNKKYKLCNNCYKENNTKHKFCKSCNNNNIFNISKLTDTPKMIDIDGNEYHINQLLFNKLQPIKENDNILKGGNIDTEKSLSDTDGNELYSVEERKIDLIPNNTNSVNKLKELSNKKQLLNMSDNSSDTASLTLSIFNSEI